MLYLSITVLICFILYVIFKPEITIKIIRQDLNAHETLLYQKEINEAIKKIQEAKTEEDKKTVDGFTQAIGEFNKFMGGE